MNTFNSHKIRLHFFLLYSRRRNLIESQRFFFHHEKSSHVIKALMNLRTKCNGTRRQMFLLHLTHIPHLSIMSWIIIHMLPFGDDNIFIFLFLATLFSWWNAAKSQRFIKIYDIDNSLTAGIRNLYAIDMANVVYYICLFPFQHIHTFSPNSSPNWNDFFLTWRLIYCVFVWLYGIWKMIMIILCGVRFVRVKN